MLPASIPINSTVSSYLTETTESSFGTQLPFSSAALISTNVNSPTFFTSAASFDISPVVFTTHSFTSLSPI